MLTFSGDGEHSIISGGVQVNVVPDELVATFDIRVTPLQELQEFNGRINQWVKDAGEGVTISYKQQHLDQVFHQMPFSSCDPKEDDVLSDTKMKKEFCTSLCVRGTLFVLVPNLDLALEANFWPLNLSLRAQIFSCLVGPTLAHAPESSLPSDLHGLIEKLTEGLNSSMYYTQFFL